MKLAETLKGDRKMKMDILPKSKVKNDKKGQMPQSLKGKLSVEF